jgi:putative phosphonate metabolism protein
MSAARADIQGADVASVAGAASSWSAAARFAIYYAPPRMSRWWDAGSAWLGRDAEHGFAHEAHAGFPALSQAHAELTKAPRRYGWHGTLVAPFRLAERVRPHDLVDAAQRWVQTKAGFVLPVEAATLGDFVALRPADEEGEARIRELASDALRTFATLRAAPAAADLERRLAAPLSERQRALLVKWGYPYVFDEFRFHMTLSDSLDLPQDRATMVAWWQAKMPELGPLPVDGIALFVEPAPGEPFVLWQRLAFKTE